MPAGHKNHMFTSFFVHLSLSQALPVLLQAEQKQMKLKVLQKVLLDQALAKQGLPPTKHKQSMKDDLLKALSSSSQFAIQGKVVSLSA